MSKPGKTGGAAANLGNYAFGPKSLKKFGPDMKRRTDQSKHPDFITAKIRDENGKDTYKLAPLKEAKRRVHALTHTTTQQKGHIAKALLGDNVRVTNPVMGGLKKAGHIIGVIVGVLVTLLASLYIFLVLPGLGMAAIAIPIVAILVLAAMVGGTAYNLNKISKQEKADAEHNMDLFWKSSSGQEFIRTGEDLEINHEQKDPDGRQRIIGSLEDAYKVSRLAISHHPDDKTPLNDNQYTFKKLTRPDSKRAIIIDSTELDKDLEVRQKLVQEAENIPHVPLTTRIKNKLIKNNEKIMNSLKKNNQQTKNS